MTTPSKPAAVDRWGARASLVCAVHCLLSGIGFGLLSVAGFGFFLSPWADAIFIGIAIVLGSIAVIAGFRHHRCLTPAAIFASGLGLVLASHFAFGHSHEGPPNIWATVLAVAGGLLLVTFHLVNSRLRGKCHEQDCLIHHE